MIIVIPVIDSEGQAWKSGDRDIPQPRFPEVGNIRIEDIPEPGFGECECAFDALCKVLLLRFQMGEDPALDGEESGRDQPWRACYDISGEQTQDTGEENSSLKYRELFFCPSLI